MIDYQKGKIYKLWSPSKNLVYYGSTTKSISQRLTQHKKNCKCYNNNNIKGYCTSYLIIDCEDFKIELVEEYPCNNKNELLIKEGEYIKNNKCVNKVVAGRTSKQWCNEDKETKEQNEKIYKWLLMLDRLENSIWGRGVYNKNEL